jgi:E3 ubiquitin-protein ligase HUWE1
VLIGTAIDELIRHHPSLKAAVFDALKATISKIEELGNTYEVPKDMRHWYYLVPASLPLSSSDGDVVMESVETETPEPSATHVQPDGDPESKNHDNHIVSFIDILGRVRCFHDRPPCISDYIIVSFWKGFSSTLPTARILSPQLTD